MRNFLCHLAIILLAYVVIFGEQPTTEEIDLIMTIIPW